MNEVVLDLYLRRRCIRVEVPLGRFTRVSDMLNNSPGEFIEGLPSAVESNSSGPAVPAPILATGLAVRLSEISFVHPISEPDSAQNPADRRPRLPFPVALEVDDWQVTGTLFLVDRIAWIDFMASAKGRFLAVGDAAVRLESGTSPSQYPIILVNGSRIGALYSGG